MGADLPAARLTRREGAEPVYLVEGDDPLTEYLRHALDGPGWLAGREAAPEECRAAAVGRLDAAAVRAAWAGRGPIFAALAADRPVWAAREGLAPLPAALRHSLEELMVWGLVLCPLGEVAAWARLGRRMSGLVTARRLETLAAAGERRLWLAPDALLTPLARDRAKELGLYLRGGRTDGAGPCGGRCMGDPEERGAPGL